MLGRGLVPRLSIGTLQLSIRCSSIHFLPSRSFPVSPPGTFRDDLPGSRSGLQNSGVCPDLSTLFEGLVFTETLYLIASVVERLRVRRAAFKRRSWRKSQALRPSEKLARSPRRGLPLGCDASPALAASSDSKNKAWQQGESRWIPSGSSDGAFAYPTSEPVDGIVWRIKRFRSSPSIFAL